eukprot:748857-Hanusia_phi.AAC.2
MVRMAGVLQGARTRACLHQETAPPSSIYRTSSSVYGPSPTRSRPSSSHSTCRKSSAGKDFHKQNLERLALLEQQSQKRNHKLMLDKEKSKVKESRSRVEKPNVQFRSEEADCQSDASRKSTPEKPSKSALGLVLTESSLRTIKTSDISTSVEEKRGERRLRSVGRSDNRKAFNTFFTPCGIPYTQVQSPRIRRDRGPVVEGADAQISDSRLKSRPASAPERTLKAGEIPGYLAQRRQQEREAALRRANEAKQPVVPSGFRLVDEAGKRSLLAEFRKLWEETMTEFLKLPAEKLTPSKAHKRRLLENVIDDLEAKIKIFQAQEVLILPENFSLSTLRPAKQVSMSEGQRIKMLNERPRPF